MKKFKQMCYDIISENSNDFTTFELTPEYIRKSIYYGCNQIFDTDIDSSSKYGPLTERLYIERSVKNNIAYGSIFNSYGIEFKIQKRDKNKNEFRIWYSDGPYPKIPEGQHNNFTILANSVDELVDKIIKLVYELYPQYHQK